MPIVTIIVKITKQTTKKHRTTVLPSRTTITTVLSSIRTTMTI